MYINAIVSIFTFLTMHMPTQGQLLGAYDTNGIQGLISVEAQAVTATAVDCVPFAQQLIAGLSTGMTNGIAQVAQASTTAAQ